MKKLILICLLPLITGLKAGGPYMNAFKMIYKDNFPLALAIYAGADDDGRSEINQDKRVKTFLKDSYEGKTLDQLTASIRKFQKALDGTKGDQDKLKKVFISLFQDEGQPGKEILKKWAPNAANAMIKEIGK